MLPATEPSARRISFTESAGPPSCESLAGARVLVVTVDPPWPTLNGGRLRAARLIDAMASSGATVHVVATSPSDTVAVPLPPGVTFEQGPASAHSKLRRLHALLAPGPKLGRLLIDPSRHRIAAALDGSDLVVWTSDYLAARFGPIAQPSVIDLADVQHQRYRSMRAVAPPLSRLAKSVEALKAARWEPVTWRGANLVIALTPQDRDTVAATGARVVLGVNGIDERPYEPSPTKGPVVMVGSYSYEPNRIAARWLIDEVWPLVRAAHPSAELVLAGHAAKAKLGDVKGAGVRLWSDFEDPEEVYRMAGVVVAPVTTGGGAQLKVAEALAFHRMVVATSYSARSAPEELAGTGAVVVADGAVRFAEAIVDALRDVDGRHRVEVAPKRGGLLPTWSRSLASAFCAMAR